MSYLAPRRSSRAGSQIPRQTGLFHKRHADRQVDGLAKLSHQAVQNAEVERRIHVALVVERVRPVLLDNWDRVLGDGRVRAGENRDGQRRWQFDATELPTLCPIRTLSIFSAAEHAH